LLAHTSREMSDNVEFVRSIYTHWERGQFDLLGWAHAEIEFVVADGPRPRRLRGLRAMLQHWRDFLTAWNRGGVVVDEYRQLSDRRVLVLLHFGQGRARATDAEDRQRGQTGAQILDVREGTITRLVTYFDRERALDELGLEA
jgi:ketosteroid isomerase-like protein